eukprot:CAMPEP_0117435736 /NCGR_PEP_ID=MMETSP0759-20121206/636_1 /TAXON_ID=63605 /ORGANISM="Percolomonas cosmopolitus, Strain WS" /LENGTH=1157 /DNA_ID=CAMNT_0005227295 /DNA_START=458 /DNA_END=3932 /DNA_ORIENTATION=+
MSKLLPEICWDKLNLPAPTDPDATTLPAAALPKLIRHAMVFIAPSSFYIYGGLDPTTNNVKNDMWRVLAAPPSPPTTTTWTVISVSLMDTNLPVEVKPRMDHSMVAYRESDAEHSLYIYGGVGDVRLKDLWRYNVDTRQWTQMASPTGNAIGYRFGHTALMITDRAQAGIDTASSRMWVFGGTDQVNIIRDDLHVYTFPSNDQTTAASAWSMSVPLTPKPPAVTQHCAAQVHDFCMYVYGGASSYSPFTATSQLWEYCATNPSDGSWVNPRPLGWTVYTPPVTTISPQGRLTRYSHICTGASDRLLIFGGRPNIGQPNYANDLIDYDPVLNAWGDVKQNTMFSNAAGTPPAGREEMASSFFSYNDDAYLILHSGRSSTTTFDDMWSINYRRPKCPEGYYSPTGTITCLPCAAGSYSLEGAYVCTNCTAGQYTNGQADNQCRDCPPGTYTVGTSVGSLGACTPCSPGTYSNVTGRNSVCDFCPVGTYSTNTTGRTYCEDCPAGTENPNVGAIVASQCTDCPPGFSSIAGSNNCTACPGGYFAPSFGEPSCSICTAGTYSDAQASICSDCPLGTSNGAPGSAGLGSCLDCPAGTYAPSLATPQCIGCVAGTYSTATRATSSAVCQQCPLGTFSNVTGAPAASYCQGCPAGTYQSQNGASECTPCPKGTWNDNIQSVGIGDCRPCPVGTYASTEGTPTEDLCTPCEVGRYQPLEGQDTCRLCPNGTYNPTTRVSLLSGCLNCHPDTYSWEGQSTCTACGLTPGDNTTIISSTERLSFSMMGWETCHSCDGSQNTGYGWVKNAHFSGDPIHDIWIPDPAASSTNCMYNITGGVLRMESFSSSVTCAYQQRFSPESESAFPFFMEASVQNGALTTGAGNAYQAEFLVTLTNGTQQYFYLDFAIAPTGSWKTQSTSHRPIQFTDKLYPENVYRIDNVLVTLRMQNMQGIVFWDDIKFSPYSTDMCNCSKVNRESQYFTIDMFQRDACEHCTIGKFCNGAGQFQCPEDTYSFGGYTSCLACSKGLACSNGIATTCGTTQFKNETSNQCQDCPLDSSCRNTDRHICRPGTYGQGLRHCLPCYPGTFCNEDGCTSCETCPSGTTSNFLRTYCYECPVGHYSPDGSSCLTCPEGTYANSTGTSQCASCPTGTTTNCLGAADIFVCKP